MTPVPSPRNLQYNDDSNIAWMVTKLEIESESDDGSNLDDEVDDMYLPRLYDIKKECAADNGYDLK